MTDETEGKTYRIRRFFKDSPGAAETVETGLSYREARDHCSHPESSSKTCESKELIALTQKRGPWFDGYDEE